MNSKEEAVLTAQITSISTVTGMLLGILPAASLEWRKQDPEGESNNLVVVVKHTGKTVETVIDPMKIMFQLVSGDREAIYKSISTEIIERVE